MQDLITVTGMILSQTPIGEYDRRICILTKERGKISAFAKGARRQNSKWLAATSPFSFGEFKLYEGRTSYNLMDASISHYFEELRQDYISAYYGMYFLEVADYYTRENNDEKEMLKLLFQSMRALLHPSLQKTLIRSIFEIKALAINGEFPGIPREGTWEEGTQYTVGFIVESSVEKLYTFTVTEQVLQQLCQLGTLYRKKIWDREFKSLEILKTLE